jgi:signal transduction histidine kinase/CheY-like chemotaxis protein
MIAREQIDQEGKMNHPRIWTFLFGKRSYPNFHTLTLSPYLILAGMVVISYIAYIFGGAGIEYELRITVLIAAGFIVPVLLSCFFLPDTSGWVSILCLILLIGTLSYWWQSSQLLFLFVVPIVLAGVQINTPAILMVAGLESVLAIAGMPALLSGQIGPTEQYGLQICIWITALTMFTAYLFIEQLFSQAATDYTQMQVLLESSRTQQFRLAEMLEDLEHANRQLSLLYEKNISLRKTAEEATTAKTNYIARVSHEIRTPLSMILGITESIIDNQDLYQDEVPQDLLDDIHIIRRNSEHLLSLVNDVLDLTRAETSRLVLHCEWTDIVDEIKKSVEIVSPLARKKKLDLRANCASGIPEIYCDRTRIRQVFLNLLTNAIRYTDRGEITISALSDQNDVTVCIRDTGSGISSEDMERIFEPFYRGRQKGHQDTIGSGLGLSVSRQFVDMHGGKVWLESQLGAGTAVFVRLPLAHDAPAPRSASSLVSEAWPWVERRRASRVPFTQQPKRHFVVCTQAGSLFQQISRFNAGIDCTQVHNVPDLIREVEQTPAHLILMNAPSMQYLLPQMEKVTQNIKDTLLIGMTFASLQEQLDVMGAAGYVQKPFSGQDLREAVFRINEHPRSILVVDDNQDIQMLIVRVLGADAEGEGVQFLVASTGKEALDIAAARRPDIILLDLALPDMSGWDIMQELRRDTQLGAIPILIVSAHDLNEEHNQSKSLVVMRGEGFTLSELMIQLVGQEEED